MRSAGSPGGSFPDTPGGRGAHALAPPLALSFSFIDDYIRCPRCFYVKRVLHLAERRTGALQLGDIVHNALETFFGLVRDAESGEGEVPEAAALMDLVEQQAARAAARDTDIDPEPDTLARARAMAAYALTIHAAQPGTHVLELENTVTFPYTVDAVEHRFTAKLDRLDRLPAGGYRLIDYKTGSASQEKLKPKKTDLQLGIYAMALRAHIGDASPDALATGDAQYWLLKTGQVGAIPFADLDEKRITATIDAAVRGILAGDYPRNERTCRGECRLLDGPPIDG